jgi:maltose alpha-D-glucosyltransferase / alpha-amylase
VPDPLWYKDAIVYELHVKAFADSNGDGTGDFRGLTGKLDYIQALGVTCLWLLPFYPSPLRDDGYDISWYQGVHPAYGTLKDFRVFLEEAHRRGLHVLTELVVNHTSDRHPWFQAARQAPPGSKARNYYVWSDTKQRYEDARIIFTDTETSNWTWDPQAGAYYWHRFFHHQPDLNYDSPDVVRSVVRAMRFWLDLGVDALRLDAVPYLIEREGTNCENLDETHAVLRQLRAEVDRRYANRMLLAEANQWPADVRPYFGDGDECHMAFHFPLMPRMFMAVEQEDRHPITEILHQTPDIPWNCQWALFLRNHDELTLEMVTDEERDYMYRAYAADPRMRLNLGIRRRLAPLVQNSRRRIELLHGLLFSLPGTPVLYYGDEIGMGDNIYLGDRNGVRTPMQWTSDRNGGFSRADPAALFAPPIMDPLYGYQAINVEAQERAPYSLLQWMKRTLGLRRQHSTFGRGTLRVLQPANRKILAFVREHAGERILIVANLARTVQPVELELADFKGLTPVEMRGRTDFPRIGDAPYFLTLAPHGFYWFLLVEQPSPVSARLAATVSDDQAAAPSLLASGVWETLLDGNVRVLIERECLPRYMARQRWFAGKARTIAAARFLDWHLLRKGRDPAFVALVEVQYLDGSAETYFLPLAFCSGTAAEAVLEQSEESVIARMTGARKGVLHDASAGQDVARELLAMIAGHVEWKTRVGAIGGAATAAFGPLVADTVLESLAVTANRGEQSNSSLSYGDRLILKLFRRLEPGPNPDLEIGLHLTAGVRYDRVPKVAGSLRYQRPGAETTTIGILHERIAHQANGWDHAIESIGRYFERAVGAPQPAAIPRPAAGLADAAASPSAALLDAMGGWLDTAAKLGQRSAELHVALSADRANPVFAPEPLTTRELAMTAARMSEAVPGTLALLERGLDSLAEDDRVEARRLLDDRVALTNGLMSLAAAQDPGQKIRLHGDYHLGQVLWSEGDFYILDFEGEPDRPLIERRAKQSPLKDVAGMIRSFGYAAWAGLNAFTVTRPSDLAGMRDWARAWQAWSALAFLRAYIAAAGSAGVLPADPVAFDTVLRVFALEKALYELRYELSHRPGWVSIPLSGIHELLHR